MDKRTDHYRPLFTLLCLATLQAAATFMIALMRHYGLKSSLLDIGVFSQALWTFIHTGVPEIAINPPYVPFHWLGFHFSPIILALAPLYAAFPFPETLLAAESLIIASSVIPIYLTCFKLGARPWLACGWACLFLWNPFVFNAAIWDFHDASFAAPIMAWAFYALVQQRFVLMLAFLGLLLLTKEHYGLAVSGFGLSWWFRYRDWKRGGSLFLFGFLCFFMIVGWLMPHLNALGGHVMFSDATGHFNRYGWMGLPLPDLLKELGLILIGPNSILYIVLLLAPVLALPLRQFSLLFPLAADGVVNMVAYGAMQKSIYAYHSVAVIGILLTVACLVSIRQSTNDPEKPYKQWMAGVIITVALLGTTFPLPPGANVWELENARLQPPKGIEDVRKHLQVDEPLSAQANVGGFFANRAYITPFPMGLEHAKTILLHLEYPFKTKDSPFGAPYGGVVSSEEYIELLQQVLDSGRYGVTYMDGPWVVLREGAPQEQNPAMKIKVRALQQHYANLSKMPFPEGWWHNPQPPIPEDRPTIHPHQ
jgi:uncharacterized membrane protein